MKRLVLFSAALVLFAVSGCSPATPAATAIPTEPAETVTLEYIGHSCFLLTASDGTRIVMDPYNNYAAPREIQKFPDDVTADLVTITHFHSDHSNINGVGGKPLAIYQPGSNSAGVVQITGYTGDHGTANNVSQGANTVFVFTIGDIKIVHLGAQGLITQPEIREAIRDADVATLDAVGDSAHPVAEMVAQLRQFGVRTIIPTHYSFTEQTRFFGAITIDEMIQLLPSAEKLVRESGSTITVTPGMPVQVILLTPAALTEQ
jgi:L-ascorbate metabolism protein UlaG (beta-lactamase superfamily)